MFTVNQKSIDSFLHGIDGAVIHDEPMAKHSPWNIGGKAQCYFPPSDKTEVVQLMCQLPGNIPVQWLGSGNSTLVREGGLKGVILGTYEGLSSIRRLDAQSLYVEAGIHNANLAKFCADKNLSGLEFLENSSATLGGAIAMSAQLEHKWSVVSQLECVNRDGDLNWISLADFRSQQRSRTHKRSAWIVAAKLKLNIFKQKKSRLSVLQRYQPRAAYSRPASISIYRQTESINPNKLLDKAGLAGWKIGGVAYHTETPNELVVRDNATVRDIESLVEHGRQEVKRQFDVDLSSLINFVGDEA